MFLGEVASLCKTIYLNLLEGTGVVGMWSIVAVGMIQLVQARRVLGHN